MYNIIISFVAGLTAIGGFFGFTPTVDSPIENLGAAPIPIAGTTYNLSGAGVSSSATSITLQSLTLPQSGVELVTTDLRTGVSDKFYITIEPGNRLKQEIVSCTTVTQSSTNDTATLSGCTRGLAPIYPYTASTTYAFTHAGGAQVIFSNPPQLYNEIIAYIDNATSTGAVDASLTVKGVVEIATGAEAAAHTAVGGGSTSAYLGLTSSIASSSAASNVVVVTKTDGTIDGSFGSSPVGSITAFASSTAPTGWLLANGQSVATSTYPALYTLLGYSYGGSGANFNVPNLTGRSIVMASSTQVATTTFNRATLGSVGGETLHTQTSNELATHTHGASGTDNTAGGSTSVLRANSTTVNTGLSASTIGNAGSSLPFNVLDPYIILNYIIKY